MCDGVGLGLVLWFVSYSHFWLCEKDAARAGQHIIHAAQEGQPIICLSALFAPVMARGPSSERALRRRPSYHLLFVSFAHLMARGPSGPAYHCLAAQFAPVMARGPSGPAYHLSFCSICLRYGCSPSSERALRRRPSYHLPFVSFAHLMARGPSGPAYRLPFCSIWPRYGARPERASLSLPCCSI